MVNIADPVTQWVFLILVSVVMGTFLLIAIAFIRRWQQIRYARYVHLLQRQYRPMVAKVLRGEQCRAGIEALRELRLPILEILMDPLFSRRKLTERQLFFLQVLCADLGLIALWQRRLANGHSGASPFPGQGATKPSPDRAIARYLLRAKSIRNLGKLRHRPSWRLLIRALDDRHVDIQLVALRSLGAVGAPESFPVLRERLHAMMQGKFPSPPLPGIQAAMGNFELGCARELAPSLHHPDSQLRSCAAEILWTMVCHEAARQPRLVLTPELLTPAMVELLLSELAADANAEVRSRVAEVIIFLPDARVFSVLQALLRDQQWFVRLRTLRALIRSPKVAAPLHPGIGECLSDPHWRVREAAIQALLALGREGTHQVFEHYLTCPDHAAREQIVEMLERTGLMSTLMEEYSAGATGLVARMVEQLARPAAAPGLSGVLRYLHPEIQQKFLDRFLAVTPSTEPPGEEKRSGPENVMELPPIIPHSPLQAA